MTRTTWVPGAAGSLWDVDNLPFGVGSYGGGAPLVCVRIGEHALAVHQAAKVDGQHFADVLAGASLNPFLAAGPDTWADVRSWLVDALTDPAREAELAPFLVPVAEVRLQLPFDVADYVDFYASLDHASNVGRMFRPDAEPLLPNWKHLPVGYHGRAGTVVVSGTDVVRPCGQAKPPTEAAPSFGPSRRLDIEAELAFVVGVGSALGSPVATADFDRHVFGVLPLNDWSARDIQAWEYVPLGPFLGKSFATSVAGWVTPLAALTRATVPLPGQDPEPLPYLQGGDWAGLDIDYEVEVNGTVVARPPYRTMYWSAAQMVAHMTVNGASLRTGDLFASGTISGPERDQRGSFLELSWGGAEPWQLPDGPRTFLEDGDEVVLRATAPGALGRIALGEVRGRIVPAREV
jgi:fumarylacetoacetase